MNEFIVKSMRLLDERFDFGKIDELTPPAKRRWKFLASIFSIGVLLVAIAIGHSIGNRIGREPTSIVFDTGQSPTQVVASGFAPAIESAFVLHENEVRATLPKKINQYTTLIEVSHAGARMRYQYVFNPGTGNKLPADFVSRMKAEVVPKVCNSKKKVLELGASYEYVYQDKTATHWAT